MEACMKGMLVRVGADQTAGGGRWNGPVDLNSGRFTYVPIPETKPNHPGHERYYGSLATHLKAHGVPLPSHFTALRMHLDPDFEHLTYGDRSTKGQQLVRTLRRGDVLVFYSGLMDTGTRRLVYAIIGLFVVDRIELAIDQPPEMTHCNAHTRRVLSADADDIVVFAQQNGSGRLSRCLPIGEYRERAYRVRSDLLAEWGGISANDGYLQRSAVFPSLLNCGRFLAWWRRQGVELVSNNNLD
jgi:hypothetical protein